MLKYIFRSATGSFSRTIGRILAYIAIATAILFLGSFINIGNVQALESTSSYWLDHNVERSFNDWRIIKWAGSNWSVVDSVAYDVKFDSSITVQDWFAAANNNSMSVNNDGITFSYALDQRLRSGYLYSVSTFVCSTSSQANLLGYATFGNTVVSSLTTEATYSVVNKVDLDVKYSLTNTRSFKSCEMYNSLIVPSLDGSWYALRLRSNPQTTSSQYFFMGYNVSELGIYTDTIKNMLSGIVAGSGLASAKSVEQVQNSVNEVKKQVSETNKKIDEVNNSIKDDKVDGAQGSANDFFKGFEDKDYGLSDVITMPLSYINKITSGTCTPLSFPAPFVNQNITLPCMYDIYQTYFGDFLNIYQTITFGVVSYWVCINIFHMVKNFKDPNNDEVEVLDL